jgi:hypothetical protein
MCAATIAWGMVRRVRRPLIGSLLLLAGLTGCGSDTNVVPLSRAEKDLSTIAMAFMDAYGRLGHGPKNADELKPFLKEFGASEAVLVSPNDGEPYVVVWGANPTQGGPTEYQGMWPIIAYESKGAGGKRAVTDIRGRPLTVPEADFPKLKFAGGRPPPSN